MPRNDRDRPTGHVCAHEAGHAFVQWYLGFPIDHVVALTEWADLRGPGNAYLGRTTGASILCEPSDEEDGSAYGILWRKHEVARAERHLMMVAAGPTAEAMRRRRPPAAVWLTAASGSDTENALAAIARSRLPEGEKALDTAIARAVALLRATAAKAAVGALTAALQASGRLDGRQVDGICAPFFEGRRPAVDAWSEAWPPSLADLRSARVPIFEDDLAADAARGSRKTAAISAALAETRDPAAVGREASSGRSLEVSAGSDPGDPRGRLGVAAGRVEVGFTSG